VGHPPSSRTDDENRWGCGATCNGFIIVDSISGTIYDGLGLDELPLRSGLNNTVAMQWNAWNFTRTANACLNETNCGLYDYVMIEGNGLKLLRKELLPMEFQFNQSPRQCHMEFPSPEKRSYRKVAFRVISGRVVGQGITLDRSSR
jgi:hypothetical protein